MTLAMVSFGALLLLRHALAPSEPRLDPVPKGAATVAGRAVLGVCAVSAVLMAGIVLRQLLASGPISLLSLLMPLAALSWVAWVGQKALRWPSDALATADDDRPSRRPPRWERLPQGGSDAPPPGSGRHAGV